MTATTPTNGRRSRTGWVKQFPIGVTIEWPTSSGVASGKVIGIANLHDSHGKWWKALIVELMKPHRGYVGTDRPDDPTEDRPSIFISTVVVGRAADPQIVSA